MFTLEELLKVLCKGQWIIVGTPNARFYEGYPDDFDVENLLKEKVLLVDVMGDGNLSITVGDWVN